MGSWEDYVMVLRSVSASDVGALKHIDSHSLMDFKGLTGPVAGLCMYSIC